MKAALLQDYSYKYNLLPGIGISRDPGVLCRFQVAAVFQLDKKGIKTYN